MSKGSGVLYGEPVRIAQAMTARIGQKGLGLEFGIVHQVHDQIVKASLRSVAVGQQVEIVPYSVPRSIRAEVIGVERETAILATFERPQNVSAGARVLVTKAVPKVAVGPHLLGQVVDGFGDIIGDGPRPAHGCPQYPLNADPQQPMDRRLTTEIMPTGLRVIDGLMTVGQGQRLGLFGPPGTGKTSLVASIAQQSQADVVVLGLVGERGREIRDMLERVMSGPRRQKVVVVASTSDRPAMERVYAARTATAIAEGFRDQGKSVMLVMDSLTRVARALREIGLAAGEAPTRRGFPASVYPALPALIERTGTDAKGSITAIYTILMEGDGEGDPIAEEVRSLTDGHIVLSRKLADAGHFPAVDVLASLSRLMRDIVTPDHLKFSHDLRHLMAKYEEIELLLQVGELKPGQDPDADAACAARPLIQAFCRQDSTDITSFSDMLSELKAAIS